MMPDNLGNSLIRQKRSGALKRVIRDDGENGLWISHPADPANMHRISRDEFRQTWAVEKTAAQQETALPLADDGNPYGELGMAGFSYDEQRAGPPDKRDRKINQYASDIVPTAIGGAIDA